MSTQEKGTFVPSALDLPHNLPTLPELNAPPEEQLLFAKVKLYEAQEKLEYFKGACGLDELRVRQLDHILDQISFYANSVAIWDIIVELKEGQTDV